MKQLNYKDGQLNLQVKKSPLITRMILFPISFLFFLLPILGMISNLIAGNGVQFFSIIIIALFSLLGFYLLRISLWNTYGEEIIMITNHKITYEANYKWFKDGKKELIFDSIIYSIKPAGYDSKNKGVLVFESEEANIESVIQIPIIELEELIATLKLKQS